MARTAPISPPVSISRPVIVGIGEVLWDMLPGGKQLGGAPANFAYHANALGAQGVVASRVGDDKLGGEALRRLESLGLGVSYVSTDRDVSLSQVALNDAIMIVAFAPIVGLLLGLSAITVPWATLVLSVALYIVLPVLVAQLVRWRLLATGQHALDALLAALQPLSLIALLATLVLLFGFQGEQIIAQPLVIALLAVPILIQVYFNSGLAYLLNRISGERHCVAGPSALIGASNFFELAVAAAIALFGLNSGAALATVVGVLIEVPVMLSVVWIVNRSRGWYEQGAAVRNTASRERTAQ